MLLGLDCADPELVLGRAEDPELPLREVAPLRGALGATREGLDDERGLRIEELPEDDDPVAGREIPIRLGLVRGTITGRLETVGAVRAPEPARYREVDGTEVPGRTPVGVRGVTVERLGRLVWPRLPPSTRIGSRAVRLR